jgi:hypothetical protein
MPPRDDLEPVGYNDGSGKVIAERDAFLFIDSP